MGLENTQGGGAGNTGALAPWIVAPRDSLQAQCTQVPQSNQGEELPVPSATPLLGAAVARQPGRHKRAAGCTTRPNLLVPTSWAADGQYADEDIGVVLWASGLPLVVSGGVHLIRASRAGGRWTPWTVCCARTTGCTHSSVRSMQFLPLIHWPTIVC